MSVFTLFSQTGGDTLAADPNDYTMGVEFAVSQDGKLTAIWFNSPTGAASLPGTIGLYAVSGGSLIHSETPTWSGAAGSGWVRAPFATPPSLAASVNYKGVILDNSLDNFYGATANYWSSGAGSGGISNGPLSAPNNAGGDGGQSTFNAGGGLAYPNVSFNASNYWVDVEVTIPGSGLLIAAIP